MASAWGIASGQMVNVSEQQLLDCAEEPAATGNAGCDGGQFLGTFEWAGTVPLCTAESYPYLGREGECGLRTCEVGIPQGAVLGYMDVEWSSEPALMDAVSRQPVTVDIEVDASGGLALYQSGTFSGGYMGYSGRPGLRRIINGSSRTPGAPTGARAATSGWPAGQAWTAWASAASSMPSYPMVELPWATTTASEPALADTTQGFLV